MLFSYIKMIWCKSRLRRLLKRKTTCRGKIDGWLLFHQQSRIAEASSYSGQEQRESPDNHGEHEILSGAAANPHDVDDTAHLLLQLSWPGLQQATVRRHALPGLVRAFRSARSRISLASVVSSHVPIAAKLYASASTDGAVSAEEQSQQSATSARRWSHGTSHTERTDLSDESATIGHAGYAILLHLHTDTDLQSPVDRRYVAI